MKKAFGVSLLAMSVLASGCGSDANGQAAAVEVAKKFDKAALDYASRAEGEDLKGTEYATEHAKQEMKEQLLSYYDFVHNVRGRQDLPEVKEVEIQDVHQISVDGKEGYLVNTAVIYNPERYQYHKNVGLKLIKVDGTWKVDEVDFQRHFDPPNKS
jgi:hypothetical protein